ncbi:Intraflagellar transport protein 22 [Coelomomyces lativittatus]|nr:Intraflagellar transport protein 22 [Coelomomyces lativittatus]KAJ1511745.1 Intraflagellar transport protein 22 [Coelomomyces lativittatus]KAJ1517386.1 Intraflagellar transport protein 22 [Coelomomyces lativittatus]
MTATSTSAVQILLSGPKHAGKTVIANFLASFPGSYQTYSPTQGVRILEFEKTLPSKSGLSKSVKVELWDTSGSESLIPIWASLSFHGYVFVINPDVCQDTTLEPWSSLVKETTPLLLFAQKHENPSQSRSRPKFNKPFHRSPLYFTSMENETDVIEKEFTGWLNTCMATV